MNSFETLIFLMFAAILLIGVAQKLHIPYPIALVIGGAVIGFIPGITPIFFEPNLLLTVVLPPLLYYAAFWISFREFKHNLRHIFSLAIGLVIATTLVIGGIFKWIFPDLPWTLAFAFGAIVSPPDAFAATTVLRHFAISTRLLTILEGESLINDASALVLYKLAVIALLIGSFSLSEAGIEFVKVVAGGISIGIVTGFVIQIFTRRFLEPIVAVVFSFINPYVTYILADRLGVSGVLAVVVNGLIGSYLIIKYHSPLRRILGYTSWDIYIILLNCFVFILIGSHLRSITETMTTHEMILYSGYGLLITFALIVIRTLWVLIERMITHFYWPKSFIKPHTHKNVLRDAAIISWSGMRGIVSLVAALALPLMLPDGHPLIGRNMVIFLTFIVILLTLIIPAVTLPLFFHFWKIRSRPKIEMTHHTRNLLIKAAEEEINRLHSLKQLNEEERLFLINYFNAHQRIFALTSTEEKHLHHLESARIMTLKVQRDLLLNLWEREEIDDKILRLLERELDIDETLSARAQIK